MPTFDVFLCYHSVDTAWVARLKTALEDKGVKVWLDSEQILPGDRFAEALERGLQASRSVALIVSAGSLHSNWVNDEYYRALGLANASSHGLRLIPVLIESVSLPGFLSTRSWADFRDPSRFDESLVRLYRGITSTRPPDSVPETTGPPSDTSAKPTPGTDELNYLARCLSREIKSVRQLYMLRLAGPLLGFAVVGSFAALNPNLQGSVSALSAVGFPLITGLVGWGVSAKQLSASQLNVTRLTCLRDGLELCRTTPGAGCPRLWTEFWRVVHRNAGLDVPA